jgi:hypothetical protein
MSTKGLYQARKAGNAEEVRRILRDDELERRAQPKQPRDPRIAIARRKKRTAAEIRAKREREYGPPGYHAFLTSRPCCACGVEGFSEFAHVGRIGKGVGRKADASQGAPLCGPHFISRLRGEGMYRGCHQSSHEGQRSFELMWDVDLNAEAAKCWTEFNSTLCQSCGSDVSCCGEVLCQQVSA